MRKGAETGEETTERQLENRERQFVQQLACRDQHTRDGDIGMQTSSGIHRARCERKSPRGQPANLS